MMTMNDTDSDDEEVQPLTSPLSSRRRQAPQHYSKQRLLFGSLLLIGFVLYGFKNQGSTFFFGLARDEEELYSMDGYSQDTAVIFPKALVDLGVYQPASDFRNSLGVPPPFWERPNNTTTARTSYIYPRKQKANQKNYHNPHKPPSPNLESWGPCYPPDSKIKWTTQEESSIFLNASSTSNKSKKKSPYKYRHKAHSTERIQAFESVQGGCRPGFLIIGAGKCGTSSLYHYLIGHPRVAPAYTKQIHYFKYHLDKPLGWYYSWFPTTQTFLESGALITGEASPGYLPYPDVVHKVKVLMPGPKIIMAARNPLDRIYSSYKYNYVQPTVEALKKGKIPGIPKQRRDDFYQQYLFSLEDFVRSELAQLQKCLYGFGIQATRDKWYDKAKWTRDAFDARDNLHDEETPHDALIELDEICYGNVVNRTVLRPQWSELQMKYPHKVIINKNVFLTQAMIGRSLYTLPLEWWYIAFKREDMLFVCTEELSDPLVIQDLALQLGLPKFNFSDVIAEGAYNVGNHRGYDKATGWEELSEEEEEGQEQNRSSSTASSSSSSNVDDIPLSPELRQQVLEFIRPFNERLFELTGKRCDWD